MLVWHMTAEGAGKCAQVLASIGQLEFFYDQAPDVMRSCSMALQLLSVAIGSYLSGAVVLAVSVVTDALGCDWLPQDLNQGRLDLFFLLLAGTLFPPQQRLPETVFEGCSLICRNQQNSCLPGKRRKTTDCIEQAQGLVRKSSMICRWGSRGKRERALFL